MRLKTLSLQQFRNHASTIVELKGESHFFLGTNGSGKTNVLDAACVLSLTKSALGFEEEDLVQWGTEFYRVRGVACSDSGHEQQIEVVSQLEPKREKAGFRNDVRVKVTSLVGEIPTVVFLPSDLDLFTGAPAERRRFLDTLLCQVTGEYLATLSNYQKTLKQRNSLLKAISSGQGSVEDLEPWDLGLADMAAGITLLRLELTEAWSALLPAEMEELGEHYNSVRIHYDRSTISRNQHELQSEFLRQLESARQRDVLIQSTTIGPHRDDWQLLVNERSIAVCGSRGQQRAALLALLFLQASYLELKKNERPVILLDDVYSELDSNHQARVLSAFAEHQVLLTGTHIPEGLPEHVVVWDVENGVVRRKLLVTSD